VHVRRNYLRGDSPSLEGKHRASDLGWIDQAGSSRGSVFTAALTPVVSGLKVLFDL